MKRILFIALLAQVGTLARAQFVGTRNNLTDTTQERYVTNSPTNAVGNSRVVEKLKDSTYHKIWSKNFIVGRLDASYNDGTPTNIIFATNLGELRRGNLSALAPDSGTFATRHWVNGLGFLTGESDPIWTAASSNYWTKTQSDARYLQSFTETDPVWKMPIPAL